MITDQLKLRNSPKIKNIFIDLCLNFKESKDLDENLDQNEAVE